MADGSSLTVVRYGDDVAAARASYEAEIADLRKQLTAARMAESRVQGALSVVEQALRAAREELAAMREQRWPTTTQEPDEWNGHSVETLGSAGRVL